MEREQLTTLVLAAQKGDNNAISALFNAFQNTVYNIALRETKDPESTATTTTRPTTTTTGAKSRHVPTAASVKTAPSVALPNTHSTTASLARIFNRNGHSPKNVK